MSTLTVIPPLPLPLDWQTYPNNTVKRFIELAVRICQPKDVAIFDGTQEEYHRICDHCEMTGMFMALNPYLYPRSYVVRSNPLDVARAEARTFVCGPAGEHLYQVPNSKIPGSVGFGWGCRAGIQGQDGNELGTSQMRDLLYHEFTGSMQGRTMYIVPFAMGPIHSEFAKLGIEITDSPYVVVNMFLTTRTGTEVLRKLAHPGAEFLPCWHSVGCPLRPGEKDVPWPCRLNNEGRFIAHFTTPDPSFPDFGPYSVMSIGSGYGGNALLGKKCYALRIASRMAAFDPVKWMAEHMLILHVRHTPKAPKGAAAIPPRDYYVCGAFPSACGKTNLAMIEVPKEFADEWKVTCLGDDIAWIRMDSQGRLCAINPESGFFGVAPGTNDQSNRNAMDAMRQGNTIFTNVGVTREGDVWWDGKTKEIPKHLIDWKGRPCPDPRPLMAIADPKERKQKLDALADSVAHGNSRYTTPCSQCPSIDSNWNTGLGVPIDAMLFGGRRRSMMPLVFRTSSWADGVIAGATLRSEETKAADKQPGSLAFDPMAMRPFVGYNMGMYFDHWMEMGRLAPNHPDIYVVNWFRRENGDVKGSFLWEGYSQNFRVLKWICELAQAKREGRPVPPDNTPLGLVPTAVDLSLDAEGHHLPQGQPRITFNPEVLRVEATPQWAQEFQEHRAFLDLFGSDLTPRVREAFDARVDRFVSAGVASAAAAKFSSSAPMHLVS